MKNLILVGGIGYSGKSNICARIQQKDSKRFPHLEFDKLYDEMHHDGEKFFHYLKQVHPHHHEAVKIECAKNGILDPNLQYAYLAVMAVEHGSLDQFARYAEDIAVPYVADKLNAFGPDVNPIFEGLFINREARTGMYKDIKCFYDNQDHSLDDIRKILIYFDLGLDMSLKRFKKGRKKNYATMDTKASTIKGHHKDQEIPTKDELPNLEIIMITNHKDVPKHIDDVMQRCNS